MTSPLKQTPYHAAHVALGAKMGPFAGYDMPIQYPMGILKEHEWVRTRAGLFDVSHMGQCRLTGSGALATLHKITPSAFGKMAPGQCKYSVLTHLHGGVIDDLIVTKLTDDDFILVLNAGCKDKDMTWIHQHLAPDTRFTYAGDHVGLLALQGPYAARALADTLLPETVVDGIPYMSGAWVSMMGHKVFITRTGYTGEDGFEIMLPPDADLTQKVWAVLAAHDDVRPIGLGARDSLRLEMGYPLYGHELDDTTSPVEAGLTWILSRKNTGFHGEARIRKELADGAPRKRMGVLLTEPGIARDGAELYSPAGEKIGVLTSGGFSPTLKQAIALAYVATPHAVEGAEVRVDVRGRRLTAKLQAPSFVRARTLKQPA
jgi:aminomethyltransferase